MVSDQKTPRPGRSADTTTSGISLVPEVTLVGPPVAERVELVRGIVSRVRIPAILYGVGVPALVAVLAAGWYAYHPGVLGSVEAAILLVGGVVAMLIPLRLGGTEIFPGVGFPVAMCLVGGPHLGAAMVAVTTGAASAFRVVAQEKEKRCWVESIGRAIYLAGTRGAAYLAASTVSSSLLKVSFPVSKVTVESVALTAMLAVVAYGLQLALNVGAAMLLGEDVKRFLTTPLPAATFLEFLGLPTGLLLAVTSSSVGWGALGVMAFLYISACFLGWSAIRARASLEARLRELELLDRSGRRMVETLDLDEVVRRFFSAVNELVRFKTMVVIIEDASMEATQVFNFDAKGNRPQLFDTEIVADTQARPEGFFWDPSGDAVFIRDILPGEGLQIRLRLDFSADSCPSEPQQVLLDALCRQAGTALANARLYWQANTDPLTGLAQRRYFERSLRRCAARKERFSVIMLDLDRFKSINDRYGHRVGDLVLVDLAKVLTGSLRATDVAARYGGEEFVILLPGAGAPEAAGVAERIRRQVEMRVVPPEQIRYTASFGVAAWEPVTGGSDPMEAVWKADEALLAAKQYGRNQVVTAASLEKQKTRH